VDINFAEDVPEIFGMKTFDYFGDGSFYLVDAPGVSILAAFS
jgi:hypothetical protein